MVTNCTFAKAKPLPRLSSLTNHVLTWSDWNHSHTDCQHGAIHLSQSVWMSSMCFYAVPNPQAINRYWSVSCLIPSYES